MPSTKQLLASVAAIAVFGNPCIAASFAPSRATVFFPEYPGSLNHSVPGFKHLDNPGTTIASTASWYGPGFYGNLTANGEVYTGRDLTAAHRTLPFGTRVRVTNLNNGLSVVVRINDDGPHVPGRSIDLSEKAAQRIKLIKSGTAPVRLEILR